MDFNKQSYESLKKQYNEAVESNQQSFVFEGNELLVSYAKYLIEYLSDKF